MGFRIEGYTQTSEVAGGTKVVPVREYRAYATPSETYFQFRRRKGSWASSGVKAQAASLADRIEGVLGLPNVTDVVYSQDVSQGGRLQDVYTTFYETADGEISGSVEQLARNFRPSETGALVAAEIAAGGDSLGS